MGTSSTLDEEVGRQQKQDIVNWTADVGGSSHPYFVRMYLFWRRMYLRSFAAKHVPLQPWLYLIKADKVGRWHHGQAPGKPTKLKSGINKLR